MILAPDPTCTLIGYLLGRRFAIHSAILAAGKLDAVYLWRSPAYHYTLYLQNHIARRMDKVLRALSPDQQTKYRSYVAEIDAIDLEASTLIPRSLDFGRPLTTLEQGNLLAANAQQDAYMGRYGRTAIEAARDFARYNIISRSA